eukprot:4692820-Ditylum_brightwellii.AAC.1
MADSLQKIVEDDDFMLGENFMMNIFQDLSDELPEFEEYLRHMTQPKRQSAIFQVLLGNLVGIRHPLLITMQEFERRLIMTQQRGLLVG